MANFPESGHPICRASSAFERGDVRSKGGGKKSVHFNGSDENIELLLRTVISANHLSVYGAIADLCKELSEYFMAPGKPEAPNHLESMEISAGLSIAGTHTNEQQQEKPGARIRATIRTIVRRPETIQTMPWCGFEACRTRTTLLHS